MVANHLDLNRCIGSNPISSAKFSTMVTIATLREKGYLVSSLKDEATITLAEADIKAAYFPSTELFTDVKTITLLYALTYSLLLRRKIVATRYGAVQKVSQYTIAADEASVTAEIRSYCVSKLEAYYEANLFEFDDILKLYDNLFLM